jgi:hypothetical protein
MQMLKRTRIVRIVGSGMAFGNQGGPTEGWALASGFFAYENIYH